MPHGVCSALGDCICQPDFAGATCGSARNTSVFVLPWDTNVMQWAVLYVPFKVRRRMASGSWSERVTVASPTPTHLPPTRAALHTLHPPVLLISPFHFGFAQSDMTMDFVIVFLMMLQLTAFETMRAVESERRAEIERNRGCVHRSNRVLIALRVCEEVRARALVYVCVRGGGFNTTLTSSPSTNYTHTPTFREVDEAVVVNVQPGEGLPIGESQGTWSTRAGAMDNWTQHPRSIFNSLKLMVCE